MSLLFVTKQLKIKMDRLTDREREQYWSWFMNRQEIEDMKKQRKSYEHIRHYKKK